MRERILIHAAAVADADGVRAPGAVLVDGNRIVIAGTPEAIGSAPDARLVDRRRHVVMPALVNAHAHLDLTHIGPNPFEGDFAEWATRIRELRASTPSEIADSARRGVALARAGGTGLVGDIAGAWSLEPLNVLRAEGLGGVGFLEMFGIGTRQEAAIARLRGLAAEIEAETGGVRAGLQPHAPYSCGLELYRAAAALGLPLATHLAETREELEFVAAATGPLADMLRSLGVLDETVTGTGRHPVEHLAEILATTPVIAAHLNYVEGPQIERLAEWPVTVAYCPRASAYFGHRDHRYAEMADVGVRVALGTDSLVCLDTPGRISVLDEMRLLYRRDGADPTLLLRMATCAGAEALGFDANLVMLRPGSTAGIIAVPCGDAERPVEAMLSTDQPPEWIVGPVSAS